MRRSEVTWKEQHLTASTRNVLGVRRVVRLVVRSVPALINRRSTTYPGEDKAA